MQKRGVSYYIGILSYVLLTVIGCTKPKSTEKATVDLKAIQTFDSIVSIDISKASHIAEKALLDADHTDSLLVKAYYYKARVSIQSGDAMKFMKYGKQTLQLADSLNSDFYKNKIHILLGRYYIQQNEYPEALKYYLEAENYFEKQKDSTNLAFVYNGLGIMNFDLKDFDKARQYFDKAFQIYQQQNDYRGIGVYYANMGNIYNIQKDFTNALAYQQESFQVFKKLRDTTNMVSAMINLSNIESQLNNVDHSLKVLDEAMTLTELKSNMVRLKERILLNYAILYTDIGAYDKAKATLSQHAAITDSLQYINGKLDALDLQMFIAGKRNNYKEEAAYTEAFYTLKDSLYGAQTKQRIEELKWQNEFEQSRLESALLKNKYQLEKDRGLYLRYAVAGIVLLCVLIIGFSWVLYKNIKNNLQISKISNEKLQEQIKTEHLEIEKERAENQVLLLRSEQQKSELDAKNREITTINLQLLAKNKIMAEITRVLEQKNKTVGSIEKDLKSILFQNQNQEKEWEQFGEVFEQIHPGFFDAIKTRYPKLSATDLRICAYIKIRMSLQETANLLNITLQSLHTSRYRLRKKLKLDSAVQLDDFIHEIEV